MSRRDTAAGADAGRVRIGDVVVVGAVGGALWFGGTAGRLLLAVLVLLVAAHRLHRRRGDTVLRTRITPHGTVVAAVGVGAFVLGRVEVLALVVVALVLDVAVGRWRLARLTFGAATAREATVGDRIDVEVRVGGVRGPVYVRLLEPLGAQFHVAGDGSGPIPHVATHRGVYPAVAVQALTVGWLGTAVSGRAEVVGLDAPVVVRPRAVRVDVPILGDLAESTDGSAAAATRGQSHEVRSLRPYLPGDPRRRVHWPTTARQGELAVVEVDGEGPEEVTISVVLPEPGGDLGDDRDHLDHVDVVTGQAMHTVHELLRHGVPVVLVTVEHDADAGDRTVSARVRSHAELGRRLATAGFGEPRTDTARPEWRLGPDVGPARPVTPSDRTAPSVTATDAATSAPAVTATDATTSARAGATSVPDDDLVRAAYFLAWAGAAAGGFTALALADQPVPGWALLAVVLAAVVAASLPWRRVLAPRFAVGVVAFWAAGAAVTGAAGGQDAVVLAAVTAWVLPRLVMIELLTGYEVELTRRDLAGRWSPESTGGLPGRWTTAVPACGAVTVLAGVAAVAPGVAALAAAAVVLLLGIWRAGTWAWPFVAWSAAVAAWLASTAVTAPLALRGAMLLAIVVLLAVTTQAETATGPALDGGAHRPSVWLVARRVVVVTALLAVVLPGGAVLLEEARARVLPSVLAAGAGASDTWVLDAGALDLTTRPALSDRVVLTVEADLPAFWRGTSYDLWDGHRWTADPAEGEDLPGAGSQADTAGTGRLNRQQVTVHAGGALLLPAAPEPVDVVVDASAGVDVDVHAWDDGTLVPAWPVGRGDAYTVTSRMPDATPARLRAADPAAVPPPILERYAGPAPLSARTARTVEEVAGHLPTVYDQVRALEGWLGGQVTYSRDAPLPAPGADVVDHFLYEARAGWCEQVATTLTLALRHLDVPARLATGYVTGDWDGRRFVVRERDAHAWVEVYFPGVGWQGFDPTAEVPLAGEAEPPDRTAGLFAAVAAGGATVMLTVLAVVAVRRRRRSAVPGAGTEETDPHPWASYADGRLRRVGGRCGLDRAPGEGIAEQAARLVERLGDERLAVAAAIVQRDAYGPTPAGVAERRFVGEVLGDAELAATALVEDPIGAARPVR